MHFTKSWISPDVADNYSLFTSCSSHLLQPCTFFMGQSYFWSAMWLSSCQCRTFNGSWVASALPGLWEELLMVTLLLQQLLFFPDVVSLHLSNPVTGDLCLYTAQKCHPASNPCGKQTVSSELWDTYHKLALGPPPVFSQFTNDPFWKGFILHRR